MTFKYFLFDLGGTLIYFDSRWEDILHELNQALWSGLANHGLKLPENDFINALFSAQEVYWKQRDIDLIEKTTYYMLRGLLEDFGIKGVQETVLRNAIAEMYTVSQAHWLVEADTVDTLRAMQQHGCRMGLISNAGDDADVQLLVDKAGGRPYMDFIISSAGFGKRKPSCEIFEHALSFWDAAPEEVVMVGDRLDVDVLGAHQVGMMGVWISRRVKGNYTVEDIKGFAPELCVDSLVELLALADGTKEA
ncbi:MAG: HAD family hydrolase [Chloroflexota bacterium]